MARARGIERNRLLVRKCMVSEDIGSLEASRLMPAILWQTKTNKRSRGSMGTKTERREALVKWSHKLAYTGKYKSYKSIELELRGEHPADARHFFRDRRQREEIDKICQDAMKGDSAPIA